MIREYIKIILKRDNHPKRGQESNFQYLFQCKLRLWSSKLILLIFCTTGLVLLGIQTGMENHLHNLENDPFSSAVHIKGRFTRADLNQLKNALFFNCDAKKFETQHPLDSKTEKKETQECHHFKSVIKAVYPYNSLYLRFIKKDGNTMTQNTYKVQSVKIPKKQSSKDADLFIKQWVQESLLIGDGYFPQKEDSQQVNENLILSRELYQALGYSIIEKPELINILTFIGPNILEIRGKKGDTLFSKMTDTEKIQYTMALPLLDVAKRLPGCDMLIPESLFHALSDGFYKPCKSIHFFDIRLADNSKFDQNTENKIIEWIYQQDFTRYLKEEPYVDPDKRFIKVRFIDAIFDDQHKQVVTKCNVKIKCLDLENKIEKAVTPFFGNDIPEFDSKKSDVDHKYYDAFLYIEKSDDIIDNIQNLSQYLKNNYGIRTDIHQIMTLKRYRQDLTQMKIILSLVLTCIGGADVSVYTC
jgi:hypothetical protein